MTLVGKKREFIGLSFFVGWRECCIVLEMQEAIWIRVMFILLVFGAALIGDSSWLVGRRKNNAYC
jgi:hypothetical protein